MKKVCLDDKFCLTSKFLAGEIGILMGKVVDATGKDSVKEDGRYYEFSDGERVHTRWAVGESVSVAMSYQKAGLDKDVFGETPGWRDKSRVNPAYMPHRVVIEDVRCMRVQDLTEEDVLKMGVHKNPAGYYMFGGDCGGSDLDWRVIFRWYFDKVSKVPYLLNPWVIVYDVTPVVGRAE